VPTDAYYGWQVTEGGKQPYAFARCDAQPMMLAGLWDLGIGPRGDQVFTTTANATARAVHDRMPVILEPDNWPLWLGEAEGYPAKLLHPPADAVLRAWPVSRRVNSPRIAN
jgi:putative SOS response-associated peptidase YedK